MNKKTDNEYVFTDRIEQDPAYIIYSNVENLESADCYRNAIKNRLRISNRKFKVATDRLKYFETKQITSFENNNSPILNLHQSTIKNVLTKKSNEELNQNEELHKMQVKSLNLVKTTKIEEILSHVINSRMCIIDTTQYENKVNPYIYFCLGVAHGLEREVIPVTNSKLDYKIPLDQAYGNYYLISMIDPEDGVEELDTVNNIAVYPLTVIPDNLGPYVEIISAPSSYHPMDSILTIKVKIWDDVVMDSVNFYY